MSPISNELSNAVKSVINEEKEEIKEN